MDALHVVHHGGTGRPSLTPEQQVDVIELCKDPKNGYREIAMAYGVSDATISRIARRAGLRRKSRPGSEANIAKEPKLKNKETAADVRAKIAQMQTELDKLKLREKELEISFEWADDSTIIVHGVDAHFIELEGVAKFRQFIQDRRKWK